MPNKAHLLTNADGTPFDYPYYIHDSYDSSDAVNKFDWTKATDETLYPENTRTQAFTKGLIALRKSTDAFRLGTKDQVDQKVSLISIPGQNGIATNDVVIAYQTIASNGDRYAVFVNADSKERSFVLSDIYKDLLKGQVLVDGERAGVEALSDLVGVELTDSAVVLAPLTATVIRLPYIITEVPDTAPKERTEESVLPIVEEVRYDATLAKGQSYVLQEGKAGKRVLVYQDVFVDGKVVATKLLSETVVDGEARIVVKGSMEANDVVEKPSLSTPTAQASEQTTSASNKESLPATGDRQGDLALLGLGLAGLGLTIAAKKKKKKSEE